MALATTPQLDDGGQPQFISNCLRELLLTLIAKTRISLAGRAIGEEGGMGFYGFICHEWNHFTGSLPYGSHIYYDVTSPIKVPQQLGGLL